MKAFNEPLDQLPLLALSVRQPWAHAIVHGWKDIENRQWNTNQRGRICIHASIFTKKNFEEDAESYREVLHDYVKASSDQQFLETPIKVKGALGFFDWRQRLIAPADPIAPPEPAQRSLF